MKKFFQGITLFEWLLWGCGVVVILVSFFAFGNTQYLYLANALVGATALIFVSKGNPVGQILSVVFGVLYGIISYFFRYYGEMITYLGMTAPTAIWALISWLKNPFRGNRSEVTVNNISKKEWGLLAALSVAVTVAFYFILRALHTANLAVSTVSVLTSFLASYLSARRSRFYALFYAFNDVVLIVLWSLACRESLTYLPMVICFVIFLVNDGYGFFHWSRSEKRQSKELNEAAAQEKAARDAAQAADGQDSGAQAEAEQNKADQPEQDPPK